MPITICIQKPVQPKREKPFASLSLTDGFKILLSACNITITHQLFRPNW